MPKATRVVQARSAAVIGAGGGALTPLALFTRLGLATRFGTGGQHWSWISRHDEAAALIHLLRSPLSGPVNLVGPVPATFDRVALLGDTDEPRLSAGVLVPLPPRSKQANIMK